MKFHKIITQQKQTLYNDTRKYRTYWIFYSKMKHNEI